jgi:hypothetical protein
VRVDEAVAVAEIVKKSMEAAFEGMLPEKRCTFTVIHGAT